MQREFNPYSLIPPANLEAEQALLGAILSKNEIFDDVAGKLKPEHFFDGAHAKVFEIMGRLYERGGVISMPLLRQFFDRDGILDDCGGGMYLRDLKESVISVLHASDYADIIIEMWRRRQLLNISQHLLELVQENDIEQESISVVSGIFERFLDGESFDNDMSTLADVADRYLEALAKPVDYSKFITTGIQEVDSLLGALSPSNLCVVAGRTGMGKSAFALNIVRNLMNEGKQVCYYTLEIPNNEIFERLITMETGVDFIRQRRQNITSQERQAIVNAAHKIKKNILFLSDAASVTPNKIKQKVRALSRKTPLACVVIDHIGLLDSNSKESNRYTEVSAIIRSLKKMAMELNIPVIALAQLNRTFAGRSDKRPQLSDLRDSGSIEQDADQVLFVYREWQDKKNEEPKKKEGETEEALAYRLADWAALEYTAEIILAKNRHGKDGDVKIRYDGTWQRFGGAK